MSRANPSGNRLKAIAVVYWRLVNSPATRGLSFGGRFHCKRKRGDTHMEDYHFWQDFFDTYQSLSDPTKALWLIVPSAFVLGLIALILRHRVAVRQAENGMRGDLVYTIHRDGDDNLCVYRHRPALEHEPALLVLEESNRGDAKQGSLG